MNGNELVAAECVEATLADEIVRPAFALAESIVAAGPDEVRRVVTRVNVSVQQRLWLVAALIERVERGALYRAWRRPNGTEYTSTADWAEVELNGLHKSNVSKFVKAVRFVEPMADSEREHWMGVSPYRVYEVLSVARQDPAAALELAAARRTDAQLRQAVREYQSDQHWDTSGLRTFRVTVSGSTYAELIAAMNLARHQSGMQHPTDDAALSAIVADFMSGIGPVEEIDDLKAGRVRCVECGSWAQIQQHHAIPRSHKIKGKEPDDYDWPCVWLCAPCHAKVTEAQGGNWRVWLDRWMAQPRLSWLRERVEAFLGGRRLEEI